MTSEAQPRTYGRAEIVMIDNEDTRPDRPTETTSLLGAGAEPGQEYGLGNSTAIESTKRRGSSMADFEGMPWWKKPSVFWLLGPYVLTTLAFGGMVVPRIELIVTLVCRRYFAELQSVDPMVSWSAGESNAQCNTAAVQKHVAAFTLVLSVLGGGLSAFTAPKLGSLSDRYGRTRLIVVASCGGILNEIITILTATYPDVLDYRFLIVGSFFDGITGSFTAVSVLGNSYVSDCSPPSKRGVALGYLQACLFTGLAFGPALAARIVLWTGSVISIFYVTLVCHIAVIFFFWFFMPESLSMKRRIAAQAKHRVEQEAIQAALLPESVGAPGSKLHPWLVALLSANPLGPLKMFVPSGRENSRLRRNLILLGFIDTILVSAALGAGTVIILYAKFVFNWGTWESSRFLSVVSFCRVIVLLLVFPVINYFFRILPLRRERRLKGIFHDDDDEETHSGADNLDIWIMRLSLLGDMMGVLGYALVRSEELFMVSAVFTSFGGLANATVQSIFTKQIPPEQVGAMLGAMGLLHALGRVFAPVMFDGIYAGTVETFPQAFVVVLASLFVLSVFASLFVRPHLVLKEDVYTAVPEGDAGDQAP
ncbi:MFS general substrate transporter [Xylaria sp. CBS 124048]|nr:MFS general substrate transporter [Xylaria sp. CBS 124048]